MAVMSSFKQQCPSCESMVSIKEGMIGKKIECPKCKDRFIAVRPEDEDSDDAPEAKKETKAKGKKETAVTGKTPPPMPKASPNGKKTSDKGDPKGKSKADANGKPARKSRPDDDDDDEDETAGNSKKKKKEAGGSKKLIIGLGLAGVGIVMLVVVAFIVMGGSGGRGGPALKGGPPAPVPGGPGQPIADPALEPGNGGKSDPTKKGGPIRNASVVPMSDAELAKLSNLLPNDTEHVLHLSCKDLFADTSPFREAVFQTRGAWDDSELKRNLGFSPLAINDLIRAENNSVGWRYTVVHFNELINEDDLQKALNLTPVDIEGEKCYQLAAHPRLEPLARYSLGIPNHFRVDDAGRDRESVVRVHNAQTLIIGDKAPVAALMKARGQFAFLSTKQAPGTVVGGGPKTPKGGAKQPPTGGVPTPGPDPSNPTGGGVAPTSDPGSTAPPPPPPGGDPSTDPANPMPGGLPGTLPPPGIPGAKTPSPVPTVRDEMFMTIKPALKAIMDRMESRGPDSKDKVLFSSATNMEANRIAAAESRGGVLRYPRQIWDVTLLLYEQKPRISALGTALVEKDMLKYQLRNEIQCNQNADADRIRTELMTRASPQIVRFIQSVLDHKVQLPSVEAKKPMPKPGPVPGPVPVPFPDPNPDPTVDPEAGGVPTQPGVVQPPPEVKKASDEPTASRIALKKQASTVEFVLDLLLDNASITRIQAAASLSAGAMRVEMETLANLSLRHALAKAGLELAEKGLSQRQLPPGAFPPGAFDRVSGRGNLVLRADREPQNRLSWMAALLPYLGQQPLFAKIDLQKSWRDPENWLAGNTIVPQFLDPMYPDHARYASLSNLPLDFAATHYVGMAGVGLDAASYKRGDPATDHKRGVFGYDVSASLDEIRKGRGLANTILAIQVPHDGMTGVSPWIAGGGATVRGVPENNSIAPFVLGADRNGKTISHDNKRGAFVMMTDGSVRFIDQNVSDEVFKAMCTVGGPAPANFDLNKNPSTPLIKLPTGQEPESKKEPAQKAPPLKAEPAKPHVEQPKKKPEVSQLSVPGKFSVDTPSGYQWSKIQELKGQIEGVAYVCTSQKSPAKVSLSAVWSPPLSSEADKQGFIMGQIDGLMNSLKLQGFRLSVTTKPNVPSPVPARVMFALGGTDPNGKSVALVGVTIFGKSAYSFVASAPTEDEARTVLAVTDSLKD